MADDGQENRLIAERRAKLARLREAGNAYPNDFHRDALADELLAAYESHSAESLAAAPVEVRVAGRLMVKRVMGGTSFVKLQDRSGQIQLMLKRDRLGEALYGEFKKWDLGDIIAARGEVVKSKTGELSVDVAELRLLAKSLRPLPEKWHGIADAEMKLRQRYVDLIMSAETRDNIRRAAVSVWLKAELALLLRRVLKRNNRPLLERDPEGVMRSLVEARYPIYATADITVESRDLPHDVMVQEIIEALAAHNLSRQPEPAAAAPSRSTGEPT